MLNRMGGVGIIVCGMTGSGKSTFVKQLISGVDVDRLLVYDVNAEYFPNEPLPDISDFLKECIAAEETIQIFEEATVFFSNRGSNADMRRLLVAKRHQRNIIILLFHSIRSIPHYIYDLCNYVVLFRTNDNEQIVSGKHEVLLPAYNYVKNKKFIYGVTPLETCYRIVGL